MNNKKSQKSGQTQLQTRVTEPSGKRGEGSNADLASDPAPTNVTPETPVVNSEPVPKLSAFATLAQKLIAAGLQISLEVLGYLSALTSLCRVPIAIFFTVVVLVCFNAILMMSVYKFGVSLLPLPFQTGLNLLVSSIFNQSNLCRLPLINMAPLCADVNYPSVEDLMAIQEFTFNNLSNNSLTHLSTAIDITQMTDRSLPDLIHLLKHSDLAGRDAIIQALTDVVHEGRPAARNLQKFGGAVQGSLDVVIGANRVYVSRLGHNRAFPSFLSTKKRNTRLLWRALVLFGSEVETINTAFVAARDSLLSLQGRLRGAVTVIQEELHLETQDRDILWRSLWDRLVHRDLIAQHDQRIKYLDRAYNVTGESLSHVSAAQVVLDVASDGFSFLKDRLDLYIDSDDIDAIELQYEIVIQSIQRLSDLRINGFGKRDMYTQKLDYSLI